MADETLQQLKIVAETEVKVNEASAKKAGKDTGKAFNDGMETVTHEVSKTLEKAINDPIRESKRMLAELARETKKMGSRGMLDIAKANAQYTKQRQPYYQAVAQKAIEEKQAKLHAEKQAMYESLFAEKPSAWEGMKATLEGVLSVTKSLGTGVLGAVSKGFNRMTASIKENLKHINGFFSAIKRIAVYRAIRWALKQITQGFNEGIQNAYQWAVVVGNQFARSMDMMATSALYLKNSLGAMTMPLVNVLAPILDHIIDQFVELINVVNKFIATITGASSWVKALKYPAEYMEQMAGSAKELKNQLLGFDDLNILNAPKSGGSASAMDYSNMFKQMELEAKNINFTKSLLTAISKSDWDAVEELLDEYINTAIERIDAKGISKSLGDKLKTAIGFVHSLLKAVDFQLIGQKIGEFISNLQLDWKMIASSWVTWHTNMLDALLGLVNGVNWTNVGNSIGDWLVGTFDAFSSWLNKIDWVTKGAEFTEALKQLIENIDWTEVARAFGEALVTAVSSALEAMASAINSYKFGQSLGDLIASSGLSAEPSYTSRPTYQGSSDPEVAYQNAMRSGNYQLAQMIARQAHIHGFANGGFPTQGTMFYAGENGAEFVGQIGGRTGVYNADQMANSLASANEIVVNTLVSVGNAVVGAINRKDTSVNITDIRRALQTSNMRYGV